MFVAGQVTSPVQEAVEAMVTIPSPAVHVVVMVIFAPSTSFMLHPESERVTVWDVASLEFISVWLHPPALSSTYFFVAACISVVGVGTIGEEAKVLIHATFSFPVLCTTALSNALVASALVTVEVVGKESSVALLVTPHCTTGIMSVPDGVTDHNALIFLSAILCWDYSWCPRCSKVSISVKD